VIENKYLSVDDFNLDKSSDECSSSKSDDSSPSCSEECQSKPVGKPHVTKKQTDRVTRIW
jgi:hypothetical protein